MRWLVEVSTLGKTDQQKFCVEAESWQRALQAARAERGEEGPMSGFSIELLEEGYRAVDPLARVRFLVKRAPDDMPVTPSTKDTRMKKDLGPKKGVAPSPPSSAEPTQRQMPAAQSSAKKLADGPKPRDDDRGSDKRGPTASVSTAVTAAKPAGLAPAVPKPAAASPATAASVASAAHGAPSAPTADAKKKGQTMTFGSTGGAANEATDRPVAADRAAPPAVGSSLPGLPPVKLLSAREQDPNESSPLTYREYAFAVPEGTSDEIGADVLRAQLRLVEAHVATAKVGKLVNLAVFDVEFTGKPPRPPLATLTWKDWKGDPVLSFPRRTGVTSKPPRPPSKAPPSLVGTMQEPIPQAPPAPHIAQPSQPPPPQQHAAPAPASRNADVLQQLPAQPAAVAQPAPVPPPPAHVLQPTPAPAAAAAPPPAPAPAPAPVQAAAQQPQARRGSIPDAPPAPVMTEMAQGASLAATPGMVRTPSGRFVRGRTTGDELITALFESMHDLHFLRDALDGGQFCLALATEVLPSRAALIHFFDIDRREWVVACTRGKDTQRLLTLRTAESDGVLLSAARKRRAVVVPNATAAESERYRQLGGARSLIVAPIMQAGRALGALEIINPLDGMPFNEDEGNAMTYIAEQYAEYLGSRGIVLDRDRITSAATAAAR